MLRRRNAAKKLGRREIAREREREQERGGSGSRLEWNEEGQDTLVSASIYSLWIVSAWQPAIRHLERRVLWGTSYEKRAPDLQLLAGIDFGGTLSLSFRSTTCLGIKLYRPDRRYKHGGSKVQTMYNMYTIRALLPVYFCNDFFLFIFFL